MDLIAEGPGKVSVDPRALVRGQVNEAAVTTPPITAAAAPPPKA